MPTAVIAVIALLVLAKWSRLRSHHDRDVAAQNNAVTAPKSSNTRLAPWGGQEAQE